LLLTKFLSKMADNNYDIPNLRALTATSLDLQPVPSQGQSQGNGNPNDATYSIAMRGTKQGDLPGIYADLRQFQGETCFGESSTDDNSILDGDRSVAEQEQLGTLVAHGSSWSNRRWLILTISLVVLSLCIAVPLTAMLTANSPAAGSSSSSSSSSDCTEGLYRVQSGCQPWSHCQQGERLASVGTPITNSVCQPCSTGTYQAASNHSLTTCQPHDLCTAGTYLSTTGTPTTNSVCQPCSTGTYQAASNHSLTTCQPHDLCTAGTYLSTTGTPTTNSVCQPCSTGTYQAASNHTLTACQPHNLCTAGTYFYASATSISNHICMPCPSGTFQPQSLHLNSTCIPKISCTSGHYAIDRNTLVDRVCLPCPVGMCKCNIAPNSPNSCFPSLDTFQSLTHHSSSDCQPCSPGFSTQNMTNSVQCL
jgi:hypothetical protein